MSDVALEIAKVFARDDARGVGFPHADLLRRGGSEIARLRRELSAARALIRWCYHDSEEMPANYADIIAAAKAAA